MFPLGQLWLNKGKGKKFPEELWVAGWVERPTCSPVTVGTELPLRGMGPSSPLQLTGDGCRGQCLLWVLWCLGLGELRRARLG